MQVMVDDDLKRAIKQLHLIEKQLLDGNVQPFEVRQPLQDILEHRSLDRSERGSLDDLCLCGHTRADHDEKQGHRCRAMYLGMVCGCASFRKFNIQALHRILSDDTFHAQLLAQLKGPKTERELADELDCGRGVVLVAMHQLAEIGVVEEVGSYWRLSLVGRKTLEALTSEPPDVVADMSDDEIERHDL